MSVIVGKSGAFCDGVPVRLGVRIGSPLAISVNRRDNELATCMNCGLDIWTVIGLAKPGEEHACSECLKAATRLEDK